MRARIIAVTVIIGLGAWLVLCSQPAFAQGAKSGKADSDARKRAEKHYKIALHYHELTEHYKAADEYLKAYALFPSAEFLFNVAQEYRFAGDHPKALFYYRKYIELDPNGRAVPVAKKYIEALTHEIGSGEAPVEPGFDQKAPPGKQGGVDVPVPEEPPAPAKESQAIKTTTVGSSPGEPPAQGKEQGGAATEQEAKPEPTTAPVVTMKVNSRGNRNLKIAGLATAGMGALSLLVGVKYAFDVSGLESDIADTTEWTPGALEKFDQGDKAESRMVIATSLGLAALAAGGALYLWGSRASGEAQVQESVVIAPVLSPTLAGIGVTGDF